MAKRRQTRQERRPAPARRTMPLWLLPAVTAVVVVGVAAVLIVNSLPRDGQTAWARFDTADVHSLAFVGGNPDHLLFGHLAPKLTSPLSTTVSRATDPGDGRDRPRHTRSAIAP